MVLSEEWARIQAEAQKRIQAVLKECPPKYRGFIQLLDKARLVWCGYGLESLSPDLQALGLWAWQGEDGKTRVYGNVKEPYMSVAGRVVWFRDLHHKDGKQIPYEIETNYSELFSIFAQSGWRTDVLETLPLVVRIKSPVFGVLEGESRVGLGVFETTNRYERRNPWEVAKTSALGRALATAGIGVFGGLASADEVLEGDSLESNPDLNSPAMENSGEGDTAPQLASGRKRSTSKEVLQPVNVLANPVVTRGIVKVKVRYGNEECIAFASDPDIGEALRQLKPGQMVTIKGALSRQNEQLLLAVKEMKPAS